MTSIPLFLSRFTRAAAAFNISLRWVERFLGLLFDLRGGIFVTEGMRFEIPKGLTTRQYRGRFMVGAHEWNERRLITRYLSADAQVLELGGGWGVVSCVINKRLRNPKAHVVLDADPRAISVLTRNRAANGAGFAVVHGVVSSRAKERVYLSPSVGSSSLVCGKPGRAQVKAPGYSIRALEQQHGLAFTCFVVDIEGAELQWAQDNREALSRVELLVLEVHPRKLSAHQLAELEALLRGCGLHRIDRLYEVEVWRRQPFIGDHGQL